MPRNDGQGLLYPGKIHSFHGESESGKSLVLLAEAIRIAQDNGEVLWVDFDSDPAEFVKRCLSMGKTDAKGLTYIRPEERPSGQEDAQRLFAHPKSLVVLDGVTDALSLFGFETGSNDDFAAFTRVLLRPFAERTGAAVVVVDHVTKSSDDRGRFALGAQAKMGIITGAAYLVEVVKLFAPGRQGEISLRVGKDRPGGVRPACGAWRARDRTQEAARIVVDARDGRTRVSVTAPEMDPFSTAGEVARDEPKRAQILDHLRENSDGESLRSIIRAVGGKTQRVQMIIESMIGDGLVRADEVTPGGSRNHYIVDTA